MKRFVVFISENNENSCSKCKMYNGRIYEENDSRKPRLPIHPKCRCSYRRYSGNLHDRNALITFFKNLPEATQITLETKYLPTGTGELIGTVKAFTMIYTEKGLWLARAKAAIYKSPKARFNMTEILLELEDANCKNDLKKSSGYITDTNDNLSDLIFCYSAVILLFQNIRSGKITI